MEPRGAEYFCAQVLQKDVSGRLQAGEELLLCLGILTQFSLLCGSQD